MLLVLRGKSGIFALQLVELLVSDSGASAMRKLRERLNQEGALKPKLKLAVLCKQMSVEIAEVNLVSNNLHTLFVPVLTSQKLQTPDLETGRCSAIINVSHRRTHELFTLAIHHPELLEEVREFIRWNHDLLLDNDTSTLTSPRRALLITCKVDRKALCIAFVAIGLRSVGEGLAASPHGLGDRDQ
jgi:hypothetical protein